MLFRDPASTTSWRPNRRGARAWRKWRHASARSLEPRSVFCTSMLPCVEIPQHCLLFAAKQRYSQFVAVACAYWHHRIGVKRLVWRWCSFSFAQAAALGASWSDTISEMIVASSACSPCMSYNVCAIVWPNIPYLVHRLLTGPSGGALLMSWLLGRLIVGLG